MYSLNIGGVKRWLTLSNAPLQDKSSHLISNAPSIQKESSQSPHSNTSTKTSAQSPPWWTSQSLSARHLEPSVPPSELKEYRHYVDQFNPQSISMTATPSQDSLLDLQDPSSPLSHPDTSLFSEHVHFAITVLNQDPTNSMTHASDESLYEMYTQTCENSQRFIPLRSDTNRYEGYSRWVSHGVYSGRTTKAV